VGIEHIGFNDLGGGAITNASRVTDCVVAIERISFDGFEGWGPHGHSRWRGWVWGVVVEAAVAPSQSVLVLQMMYVDDACLRN
jgi:hypothetical protein